MSTNINPPIRNVCKIVLNTARPRFGFFAPSFDEDVQRLYGNVLASATIEHLATLWMLGGIDALDTHVRAVCDGMVWGGPPEPPAEINGV